MNHHQSESGRIFIGLCDGCQKPIDHPSSLQLKLLLIAKAIRMTPLPERAISRVEGEGDLDGVTLTIHIKESAISLHTWPAKRRVRIVIDSCGYYSLEEIIGLVKSAFNPVKIRYKFVEVPEDLEELV